MWKEFKNFAIKGNVIDLAIGVVIGGAFGKIVTSFVNDIITPLISPLLGRMDFTNLFISLNGTWYNTLEEAKKAGAATINYGLFLTNVMDFAIVSFSIFFVIRQLNRFSRKAPDTESRVIDCPFCLTSIPKKAVRCPHCTSHFHEAESNG